MRHLLQCMVFAPLLFPANWGCRAPKSSSDVSAASRVVITQSSVAASDLATLNEALRLIRELRHLTIPEKGMVSFQSALMAQIFNQKTLSVLSVADTTLLRLLLGSPEAMSIISKLVNKGPEVRLAQANKKGVVATGMLTKEDVLRLREIAKGFGLGPARMHEHLSVRTDKQSIGYSDMRLLVTHDVEGSNGSNIIANADLVNDGWIALVKKAKKQIVLNTFEFDLMPLADELIQAKARNLDIRVGVDGNNIDRPGEIAAVSAMENAGIRVERIPATGLNHQKMLAIDWEIPDGGHVAFASANMTHSCSDPLGDVGPILRRYLPNQGARNLARALGSIPNANHMIVVKSDTLAAIANHQLSKLIHPRGCARRGGDIVTADRAGGGYCEKGSSNSAMVGVFKVERDQKQDGGEAVLLTFSPSRAEVVKFLASLFDLDEAKSGPISMAQFAFSSELFQAKLMESIVGRSFTAVGDKPFALAFWSRYLHMVGYERPKSAKGVPRPFVRRSNTQVSEVVLNSIFIPKKVFGVRVLSENEVDVALKSVKVQNTSLRNSLVGQHVTSKIHHKLMAAGAVATLGTSFNFSKAADRNTEQVLVTIDPLFGRAAHGITRALAGHCKLLSEKASSRASVSDKVLTSEAVADQDEVPDPNDKAFEIEGAREIEASGELDSELLQAEQ
jgi:hypothetical protein